MPDAPRILAKLPAQLPAKKDALEREFARTIMELILQLPQAMPDRFIPTLAATIPLRPQPTPTECKRKEDRFKGLMHGWLKCHQFH